MGQGLKLHETMEIHELLNFTTIHLTKNKLIQGIVFDEELKALLTKDVQHSKRAVTTLQGLLRSTALQ